MSNLPVIIKSVIVFFKLANAVWPALAKLLATSLSIADLNPSLNSPIFSVKKLICFVVSSIPILISSGVISSKDWLILSIINFTFSIATALPSKDGINSFNSFFNCAASVCNLSYSGVLDCSNALNCKFNISTAAAKSSIVFGLSKALNNLSKNPV